MPKPRKNRLTLEALANHYKPSKRFTPLQISRMSKEEQEPYFKTKRKDKKKIKKYDLFENI
mgnify:CR=1 FL=1